MNAKILRGSGDWVNRLYWGYIRAILGSYWGYIGLFRGFIEVI